MKTNVAALFVEEKGPYANLPGVDAWGVSRDARRYNGPFPVVGHSPCDSWGQYATNHGGRVGNDEGCFSHALLSVRKFGGVLEHPEASKAWAAHGLFKPPFSGGWVVADEFGGWTCCVDQGHYGHLAQKSTWLYAVARWLPSLRWGRARGKRELENLSKKQRLETPVQFRDILLEIARRSHTG